MYVKYSEMGVDIVVVDASNRKEAKEEIMTEHAITLPVVLDSEDISHQGYKIYATPTTLIVDRGGRVIFKHIGFGPGVEKMMEKEIDLLLERETT
jgi:hypothetical protein